MAACSGWISTVGCTLFVDNATEGTADQAITGHTSVSFSGEESTEVDVTALCDLEKQFGNGLVDLGTVDIALNINYEDMGQNKLRAARGSNTVKTFKFVLPNGKYITFTAIVRTGSLEAGMDDKFTSAMALRLKSKPQVYADDDTLIGNI